MCHHGNYSSQICYFGHMKKAQYITQFTKHKIKICNNTHYFSSMPLSTPVSHQILVKSRISESRVVKDVIRLTIYFRRKSKIF